MQRTEIDGRLLRGQRSRAKILECAVTAASADGLNALSIGRVAGDAGIAKSNIGVLFGDREALQLATLDRAMELFREHVIVPAEREADPVERILVWIDTWFNFVSTRVLPGGCFLNAVSYEFRGHPGPIQDRINEYRVRARQRLVQWIDDARRAGRMVESVDAAALAFHLLAYQSSANVASLIGEPEQFERAHAASRAAVESFAIALRVSGTKAGKARASSSRHKVD